MYDVGGKLLSGIKSMYADSLTCVRVKRDMSEWDKIGVLCPLGSSSDGSENGDGKAGTGWR